MANSKYKAPNGGYYSQNDIDYLMNNGYSLNDALDALSKSDKYRQATPKVVAKSAKVGNIAQKLNNAATTVKKSKFSKHKAPNGNFYEQNDIDYLKSQGYSERDALYALSKSDKYRKKTSNVGSGNVSSGGRRTGNSGRSSSGSGGKVGRAAKMAALAAGGGAVALAAQQAYAQYQETGDIEIIDAFLVEWEEEIDWNEVDWNEVELNDFEEIEDDELEEEIEETEAEMEMDEAEMELDETGYDEGGYDEGGYDEGGYDEGGYDEGGYDEGGYDEGGYDEGGYDEGGYDEGGYDEGGYDEGGYDEGGYDEGGYDD